MGIGSRGTDAALVARALDEIARVHVLVDHPRIPTIGAEVLAGMPPTPVADYVAVLIAARSPVSFCDIGEILRRVLAAAVSPDNAELFHIVRWFDVRFVPEQPGAWLALGDGPRRSLGRAHRQILKALLVAPRSDPKRTLTVWELLEAGWPGEDPVPDAGANRVYVAVTRMRQLGLRQAIERDGDGYRLRPDATVKVVG